MNRDKIIVLTEEILLRILTLNNFNLPYSLEEFILFYIDNINTIDKGNFLKEISSYILNILDLKGNFKNIDFKKIETELKNNLEEKIITPIRINLEKKVSQDDKKTPLTKTKLKITADGTIEQDLLKFYKELRKIEAMFFSFISKNIQAIIFNILEEQININSDSQGLIKINPQELQSLDYTYLNFSKPAQYLENNEDIINKLDYVYTDKAQKTPTFLKVVTDENNANIQGINKINSFDFHIINIVSTLWAENKTIFTNREIWKMLTGERKSRQLSKNQVDKIENSLEKLSLIRITINYQEELKLRRIDTETNKFKIKNYALPLKTIEITTGREPFKAYKILDIPPLYEYGQITKQIEKISDIYFQGLGFDETGTNFYIVKRITMLQRIKANNKSAKIGNYNKIDLSEMCSQLGILEQFNNRNTKRTIIKDIKKAFEIWKERGLIKNYTFTTNGGKEAKRNQIILGVKFNI